MKLPYKIGLWILVLSIGILFSTATTVSAFEFKPFQFWQFSFTSPATPQPLIIATPNPVILATSIPTATSKPSLTPKPSPKATIKPTVKPVAQLSVKDYLLQKVNEFRSSKGLSSVRSDPYTCNFALIRAREISNSFNHNGFSDRLNSKTLPYPSYKEVTENIAMNSNYQEVIPMWINSPGHNANMQKDTPFVCIEAAGSFYAYEGWKP